MKDQRIYTQAEAKRYFDAEAAIVLLANNFGIVNHPVLWNMSDIATSLIAKVDNPLDRLELQRFWEKCIDDSIIARLN